MSKFIGVQNDILKSVEKNQLVSAGAGSGKTTVMVQKIADLILKENVDVSNLLVVTFTVLAAEEMKQRLIKKLVEETVAQPARKEEILSKIEQIKTASIDTIDGFSSKTIKKYFYVLEISPNVEIISDSTKDYYITRAMKRTLDDFCKNQNEVTLMLDLFAGNRRNLQAVEELVLTTYNNIISLTDYEAFLDKAETEYEDSLISEKIINEKICLTASMVEKNIIETYSNFDSAVKLKLQAFVEQLKPFNVYLNFKHNLQLLNEITFVNFSSKEYKENVGLKELNLKIKDLENIKSEFKNNDINLNFEEKNQKIKEYLTIFIKILKNFIKNYNILKEKNNLIDFNDLNRLMIKLLKNKEIVLELQNKYSHIFIDEYQDVSPLQDSIMSKIVSNNTTVFMVGDVKQSIYGFRGASPEWFLSKYNNLKTGKLQGSAFDMNLNFRSNPIILNFINELFENIMTENTADINYKRDCIIEPQRDDIVDSKVHIALFGSTTETEVEKGVYSVKDNKNNKMSSVKDMEAKYVLNVINELIGTEFYDANLKQTRKLTYGDIAILSRSEKDDKAERLIETLKQNAIPLSLTNKLETGKSEGIKLVISILKCVANIADDVDYLATFMSLADIDIDDVIELRDKENSLIDNLKNCDKENVQQGFEILNDILNATYTRTNTEIIRYILDDKKLKYFILTKPNGEKELNSIEEFLQKISVVENSLNLAEFIDMVESNVSKSSDFVSKDNENSVTIQTIHKSKGLEYPVVILYNAGKLFSYLTETDSINYNADVGLGFDYFDTINRVKSPSIVKYAINERNKQKGYKEEMRLLYVALTRAKNKLYITGNYTKKALVEKEINNNSYINMILSCFADKISGEKTELKNCIIEVFDDYDFYLTKEADLKRNVEVLAQDFDYKNSFKFKIPFKNTVTGLNSEKSQTDGFKTQAWLNKSIQYETTEDLALIGTHYHKALEELDLQAEYKQTTNFEDIDYAKIKTAHTVLKDIIKDAVAIKKEAEFMMYVPYKDIVESDVEDKVLIQGVVDLIIERENTIDIVDYKFSKLPAVLLKQKYAEQLNLYKLAVERAFNKPVEHVYIYSINSGELV